MDLTRRSTKPGASWTCGTLPSPSSAAFFCVGDEDVDEPDDELVVTMVMYAMHQKVGVVTLVIVSEWSTITNTEISDLRPRAIKSSISQSLK